MAWSRAFQKCLICHFLDLEGGFRGGGDQIDPPPAYRGFQVPQQGLG